MSKVQVTCASCGKQFSVISAEYNRQTTKNKNKKWLCSKACLSVWRTKERQAANCKKCGKQFVVKEPGQLYCCRECANRDRDWSTEKRVAFSIAQRMRACKGGEIVDVRKCKQCGRLLAKNRMFCSPECMRKFSEDELVKRIENAGVFPAATHGETDRRVARRYIVAKFGNKCAMCGATGVKLVCDHIDGDAMNSSIGNLRLLCESCDRSTPTYKNKPHKANRPWRRKKNK